MSASVPPRAPWSQRAREGARRSASDNLALKALSLFVALGIWAFLQREQVVETRARATIEYVWPADLVLVNDANLTTTLSVRGPQGIVRTLDDRQLSLKVDLSDMLEGTHSVDFTDKPIRGLPSGVQVVGYSPGSAPVEFDQAMDRQVKVRPAVIGDIAEGYRSVSVSVEPDTVEIAGPQSLVRNIAEVSTDIVDISGWRETRKVKVPLSIDRRSVRPVEPTEITVTVEIEPLLTQRTFNDVQVIERAAGWLAEPDTARVAIQGPAPVLKTIDPAELSVLLHLPSPTPVGEEVRLRWVPGDSFTDADGGVQVVLPSGLSDVDVSDVAPARFTLRPEDESP